MQLFSVHRELSDKTITDGLFIRVVYIAHIHRINLLNQSIYMYSRMVIILGHYLDKAKIITARQW
jgi:hypothetical protein